MRFVIIEVEEESFARRFFAGLIFLLIVGGVIGLALGK
jgi:hypothetical protein